MYNFKCGKNFLPRDPLEILNIDSNTELNNKQMNDISMMGSMSYKFVEIIDTLNTQYNYYRLEMIEDEKILLQVYKQHNNI